MDLALLAGAGVLGYLQTQKQRENYFKSQNQTNLNTMLKNSGYVQGTFPNPYGSYIPNNNSYNAPNLHNNPLIMNRNSPIQGSLTPQQAEQMKFYSNSPNLQLNNMFANEQKLMASQYNMQNQFQNQQNQFQNKNQNQNQNIERFENIPTEPVIEPKKYSIEPIEPMIYTNNEQSILSTNDFLLDVSKRSITDFSNNNMVPHAKKFTQNMAGTGVAQGNYIQDVTVDSGFDKSSPFQSQLNSFTGISDTYSHKREAGPMFSPAEQQQNWVYKQPVLKPDDERYTMSMTKRNNMVPVQPVQVGPGLNTDPRIPATGGFHEFTRILPNNISDYKANQLEGRINMGKLSTAGLPQAYPGIGGSMNNKPIGVPKNRPPKDWSQARRPTMTTKVGFIKNTELLRSDYQVDERPKNATRDQTSFGYGSVKPNGNINASLTKQNQNIQNDDKPCLTYEEPIGIAPARPSMNLSNRSPTYMSLDNNIRSKADCNSTPIGNPVGSKKTGPMLTNYYVNETDRGTVNPAIIEQVGIKGQNKGTFYTYDDKPKTTMKETNEFAYIGDPNKAGAKGTFYSYEDMPKTTMKETNEFAYIGDPNRAGNKGKFYSYEDKPRSTIKQSTNFSYSGIANTGKSKFIEQSRFQYTGPERKSFNSSKENFNDVDYNDLKSSLNTLNNFNSEIGLSADSGGADTYTLKSTTLVKNYFPGPMRQNIRQDAEDIMGKIDFGTFGNDSNMNGPGSLAQALPNPSRMQNNRFVAVPNANPNKLVNVDDRQLASYQNSQLKNNPLSIYTNKPESDIPSFYADNNPTDFSDLITKQQDEYVDEEIEKSKQNNKSLPNLGQNVYPPNNDVYSISTDNPNTSIVYNNQTENEYNPMISQGSSRKVNNPVDFMGKAYSGKFDGSEYGPDYTFEKMAFNDYGLENGAIIEDDTDYVCKPNYALDFGTNTLILDRDLK